MMKLWMLAWVPLLVLLGLVKNEKPAYASSCGSIGDADLRYYCSGSNGSIGDSDLRHYATGSCGSVGDSDLRNYCNTSCGSVGNADLRYLCQSGKKYPGKR